MARLAMWLPCLSLLLGATSSAQNVNGDRDDIRCSYSRRTLCGEKGCRNVPLGDAYLLTPPITEIEAAAVRGADGTFPTFSVRRCDGKGCTPVDVTSRIDGAYLHLSAPGNGYLATFLTLDSALLGRRGDFVEVGTFLLGVEVTYGHCPK